MNEELKNEIEESMQAEGAETTVETSAETEAEILTEAAVDTLTENAAVSTETAASIKEDAHAPYYPESETESKEIKYSETIEVMEETAPSEHFYAYGTGDETIEKEKKVKEKKKPGLFFRAVRKTVAAVLIGAIAGAAFYGTAYLGYIKFPIKQEVVVPETTAAQISKVDTDKFYNNSNDGTMNLLEGSSASVYSGMDVASVVESVRPSVVAISGTVTYTSSNFYFFYNGGSYTQEVPCSGSGIIIGTNDEELLMVTNAHVVEDVNNLQVEFCDGSFVDVAIKGIKSDSDLAVVAAKLSDISSETRASIAIAKLGDSSAAKVGEFVLALGNAEGRGISATYGIISATNKTLNVDNVVYDDLIQTDAAINPGNSGGALVNARGEVIGINSVKMSDTSVEGMGYAIAVSSVSDIIDDLMTQVTRSEKYSDEERGYLGVKGVTVTSEFAQVYGLPEGVLVQSVTENSAAENAGIMAYDIITKFDGKTIDSWETLYNMMNYYQVGEEVEVVYYHLEGSEYKEIAVNVTLCGKPETTQSQTPGNRNQR